MPALTTLRDPRLLRWAALASVVANVVIVVTGGAVRLSDSGLGCPTWPRCTEATLTPTRAYAIHGIIEFTNRQLTFVLVLVALVTWLLALRRRRQRPLATIALLGVPAQAVLGGFTVLTHLNPWLVACHFLLSSALIAVTFVLWWRLREPGPAEPALPLPTPAIWLARTSVAVTAAVLVLGTIVTGSGPHAGSRDVDGTVHRTGLQVSSMAQLHADAVMVLIGVSVGLLALLFAIRSPRDVRRAAVLLLAIEAAQAGIGYAQYFLHVPPLLVGLHMLGACLVWLAALRVLLAAAAVGRPVVVPRGTTRAAVTAAG